MSLTHSNIFNIGKIAPNFTLLDVISDKKISLEESRGQKGTVIMFICNHCPFVIHVNEQLVSIANEYIEKGIEFIAISSNDIENYPQDAPLYMKEVAQKLNYPFPYLFDETQQVAKQYDAACTPDFYLFDENLKAVYHGQLDDTRPKGAKSDGKDLRLAMEKLIANQEPIETQKPSVGCNIKWK